MGIETYMITGDNRKMAEIVGKAVGIDHVTAEVLPGDNADQVRILQEKGRKVAFVRDGINDAPALAQSVSVLLNSLRLKRIKLEV